MEELTNHPIRIGHNPNRDSYIVAELRHILTRSISNHH